jgi:protein-L-isoaspartate(D-aspartate) O-methyltransferase
VLLLACGAPAAAPQQGAAAGREEMFRMRREELVDVLRREGIKDERVLAAIGRVPRHRFVPDSAQDEAYANYPLPIGHEQTISQPYIVALMTEAAALRPGAKVLEVGTGSGYQAAVLADLLDLAPGRTSSAKVASIEIVEPLGRAADALLRELGYRVDVRVGDGYRGWPEDAPFDAILVTAAPDHVPQPLLDQLAVGGRLVIPVGGEHDVQELRVIERTKDGIVERDLVPVRFVPMTGEAQRPVPRSGPTR